MPPLVLMLTTQRGSIRKRCATALRVVACAVSPEKSFGIQVAPHLTKLRGQRKSNTSRIVQAAVAEILLGHAYMLER